MMGLTFLLAKTNLEKLEGSYKTKVYSSVIDNSNTIFMKFKKSLTKIDSIILANYILKHHGPMSHLKLQKLLFYCDAYHLAYFDDELIEDKFEAWLHGPVCRKLYDSLKDKSILYSDVGYSENGIDVDKAIDDLTSSQKELIKDVLKQLSTWTGFELEQATRNETPWKEARKGYGEADICYVPIDKEIMRTFYKSDLNV